MFLRLPPPCSWVRRIQVWIDVVALPLGLALAVFEIPLRKSSEDETISMKASLLTDSEQNYVRAVIVDCLKAKGM